jgi:hypothetical protein
VLYLHAVWFVTGAVEFELPVCIRSWWNIGHSSDIESASPTKVSNEKTENKDKMIRKEIIILGVIKLH